MGDKSFWEKHKEMFGLTCPKCGKEFVPLSEEPSSIRRNGMMFDSHCRCICKLEESNDD